jgi:hypothetical protein
MAIAIRSLGSAAAAAWDAFVEAHPDGTFFHRAAWSRIVEQAFGHRTCYVYAERDGAITGVLPLAHVKTLPFGNTLISVPFCVYGGPLAADQETAAALAEHAATLLARSGASAVEFRLRGPDDEMAGPSPVMKMNRPEPPGSMPAITEGNAGDGKSNAAADRPARSSIGVSGTERGWLTRPDLYVTFRKQIDADHDSNLKSIPRKQRAMLRKGIQNGLCSIVHRDVRQLHGIYAESVRNLGTPVFSRRYFAMLADMFGTDCDVLTVLDGGSPIASVMNFYFRDEVLPYYGGGTPLARQRAGNDFMYWEVMRRAADRGCRIFDFGRSKVDTGAYHFKKNWGFTPTPLNYAFKLRVGDAIPDVNPLNPKYRLMIETWKHLPLPVANLLGPFVVRNLG